MIVTFSVSNFRSFNQEETLNLVASNRIADHPSHLVPIPNSKEKILKAGVLYGANGAGKSNLFKALRFLRQILLEPAKHRNGTGREPFLLSKKTKENPSVFDLQVLVNGNLFRLGVKLNDSAVLEEWLVKIVNGKEQFLIERMTDANGRTEVTVSGSAKQKALAQVGGPTNQSFHSTLFSILPVEDWGDDLLAIHKWLNSGLQLVSPQDSLYAPELMFSHLSGLKDFTSQYLRAASTGVKELIVDKTPLSKEALAALVQDEAELNGILKDLSDDSVGVRMKASDGTTSSIWKEDGALFLSKLRSLHFDDEGVKVPFEIGQESDGTQRLMHLIPALFQMSKNPGVFVIDEIDRSLHPLLVHKFLESFFKVCPFAESQILVTTHESNLLDLDLLRRDEIWFAEKDHQSATHLFSLLDFKPRTDNSVRNWYLDGRYGAIPFLGAVDQLWPEPASSK